MTEAEWLACQDPMPMLKLLQGKVSERKLRLFGCACCRRIVHLLSDQGFIRAIEVAELFADKQVTDEECRSASKIVRDFYSSADSQGRQGNNADLAVAWAGMVSGTGIYPVQYVGYVVENACRLGERWIYNQPLTDPQREELARQTTLLRDIAPNPLRLEPFSLEWRTDTALQLACQMYESRDFSAMPILADALQDAGCDNEDILSHCRGPGPHVRGCWVVDLVLGKE